MSKLTRAIVYHANGDIVSFVNGHNMDSFEGYVRNAKDIRSLAITETMTKEEYMIMSSRTNER